MPHRYTREARGRLVEHPRRVAGREVQNVKFVTVLLIREPDRIRRRRIGIDRRLNRMGRYPHDLIASAHHHDVAAAFALREPKKVFAVDYQGGGSADPMLDIETIDPRKGEPRSSGIIPNLGLELLEKPDFPADHDRAHKVVGITRGVTEIERIPGREIEE